MKTMSKFNLKVFAVIFALLFGGLCFLTLSPQKSTSASNFTPISITDTNNRLKMQMSATGRTQGVSVPFGTQTVSAVVGEETLSYTYYTFKWRDISYLTFSFSADIDNSSNQYTAYEFKLTYIETEDMATPFGTGKETTLTNGNISENSFNSFSFDYHIDSNADIYESTTRCKGNDFGLYKFDFTYTFSSGETKDITRSLGAFYVAIQPDDIDTATHENMQILYSVSSSNKLMNVYNLYLSTDDYKYVNPKYIEWVVIGMDKAKTNYVYSEKMRNDNISYANYKAIWPTSQSEPYGTSFLFDSNDIEGEWTAICIIKDSQGNEKARFTADGLSTIKKEEKSYIWLILIIVVSVLLLGGIIALIVFYLKRDKIW